MDERRYLTIAEMARVSGLSTDTLRWYEREGILPRVGRSSTGHRRYSERDQGILALLVALRDTGMSTSDMKHFVELMDEGAASHGRRIALLEREREMLTASAGASLTGPKLHSKARSSITSSSLPLVSTARELPYPRIYGHSKRHDPEEMEPDTCNKS